MNGVAKQFWSEVYDLKTPAQDDPGRRAAWRPRKKLVRRLQVRRVSRRAVA